MLALRAGGNFHAAPDQVVALRHAVLVAHVIERALLGGIIRDEQELMAILLLDPLVGEVLRLGGQVAFLAVRALVAEFLFQLGVQVGQLDDRERRGRHDHRHAEHALDVLAVGLLDLGERIGQQLLLHLHHVAEGFDVAELQIEAGEFGRVLAGEGLLRAEHRPHLEDALKAGGHRHLLVELRALRQIRLAVEILDLEHVRAGFARRADELRGVDLHEPARQQEFAHGVNHNGLRLEHQLVRVGAQVDPAIVDALVDGRALMPLARLAVDRQRRGQRLDDDLLGIDFNAAELDVLALHSPADDGNHGIQGDLVDGVIQRLVLALFHGDLHLAGNILEHDEGHLALVADVLHEAADLDFVRAAHLSRIRSFHKRYPPIYWFIQILLYRHFPPNQDPNAFAA